MKKILLIVSCFFILIACGDPSNNNEKEIELIQLNDINNWYSDNYSINEKFISKNIDLVDTTADILAVPGISGLVGGKYDYYIFGDKKLELQSNTDTNAILFNGVTSTLGAGLGNRADKFINGMQKSGLENTIGTVTNTATSFLEQELNKIYGNNNQK
ncbi:hypothetical protein [Empedobacter falsenii]|uniref:Lipoprotein n=1 Tax=Empedobacter falsenii TaxID=343874 RepID=A0A3R8Z7Z0_9FLAO|nr:hypothetical protein [Empedobacter falsenii]RRT91211.1 hypothetical protein EGI89_09085 [Empedobacter falsenii]RRT91265.1 hypothetical protein EGI88_09015 [Empedobacter falsenii]